MSRVICLYRMVKHKLDINFHTQYILYWGTFSKPLTDLLYAKTYISEILWAERSFCYDGDRVFDVLDGNTHKTQYNIHISVGRFACEVKEDSADVMMMSCADRCVEGQQKQKCAHRVRCVVCSRERGQATTRRKPHSCRREWNARNFDWYARAREAGLRSSRSKQQAPRDATTSVSGGCWGEAKFGNEVLRIFGQMAIKIQILFRF